MKASDFLPLLTLDATVYALYFSRQNNPKKSFEAVHNILRYALSKQYNAVSFLLVFSTKESGSAGKSKIAISRGRPIKKYLEKMYIRTFIWFL